MSVVHGCPCSSQHRKKAWSRQDEAHQRTQSVTTTKVLASVWQYLKIKWEDNTAGGLTKHVRCEVAQRYAQTVRMKLSAGRATSGLKSNS